jgi:hypothetical protein
LKKLSTFCPGITLSLVHYTYFQTTIWYCSTFFLLIVPLRGCGCVLSLSPYAPFRPRPSRSKSLSAFVTASILFVYVHCASRITWMRQAGHWLILCNFATSWTAEDRHVGSVRDHASFPRCRVMRKKVKVVHESISHDLSPIQKRECPICHGMGHLPLRVKCPQSQNELGGVITSHSGCWGGMSLVMCPALDVRWNRINR